MKSKIIFGYTYGVFDLIHPGHVMLLKRAKTLCDRLVVGIVSDEAVKEKKGKDRPFMPEIDRFTMVQNMRVVDSVVLQKTFDPSENLVSLKETYSMEISKLIKGNANVFGLETAKKFGIQVIILDETPGYSTTALVKSIIEKMKGGANESNS